MVCPPPHAAPGQLPSSPSTEMRKKSLHCLGSYCVALADGSQRPTSPPVSSLGRCVGRLRLRVESQGPRGRSVAGCAARFSVVWHSYRWEGGALELRAARIQGCFSVAGWGRCVKDTGFVPLTTVRRPQEWRQAGISYLRYANICAQVDSSPGASCAILWHAQLACAA